MRRSTHVRLVPCAYDFSRLRSEISASSGGAFHFDWRRRGRLLARENNDMGGL